ncbi:MAG TPA: DHA2 family efflux MFS transporter permease subunit [Solirubrobacteraceae bacterium]|jgi:EmrB/QacA subfamily drug resistance transporter|nr:DHA2 family efflux MFS transporter permease subunit [Solirubrobacteraceae bacterium]
MTTETRTQPAKSSRQALTVLLTSVANFMVTLDALVVVTALPSIHRSLGGGIATLQWTLTAYTMSFGAGIVTAAELGDRFGRRRVYLTGLTTFTAASAMCALAPSAGLLIGFRVLQGLGAACVMPLGMTLLTSAFPPQRRGAIVGIWQGVAGLAVASGPLVGGALTQGASWHWIFWVNVPVGVVAAIGARYHLKESHGPRSRLDLPALLLVTVGVALLIWGVVSGGQDGWGATANVTGIATGLVALAGFVYREATTPQPMIPLSLFANRTFSSVVGTQFLMSASIYAAAFITSEFFQLGLGNSPLTAGLKFLPWTATPLIFAPPAGILFDRVGARVLVVPGLAMQAGGFAWIVALAANHSGYASYIVPFVIAGIGISLSMPCVAAAGLSAAPHSLLGKAAGTINTLQQFGAVFGVAIVTAVFNAHGSLASPAGVTSGFKPALGVAAGLSLLGAVTALAMRSGNRGLVNSAASSVPGRDVEALSGLVDVASGS